jgi:hypothetical protein
MPAQRSSGHHHRCRYLSVLCADRARQFLHRRCRCSDDVCLTPPCTSFKAAVAIPENGHSVSLVKKASASATGLTPRPHLSIKNAQVSIITIRESPGKGFCNNTSDEGRWKPLGVKHRQIVQRAHDRIADAPVRLLKDFSNVFRMPTSSCEGGLHVQSSSEVPGVAILGHFGKPTMRSRSNRPSVADRLIAPVPWSRRARTLAQH